MVPPDEDVSAGSILRELIFNQYQAIVFGGAVVASALTLNPLPFLFWLGSELVLLPILDSGPMRRLVARRKLALARGQAASARTRLLGALTPANAARVAAMEDISRQIEANPSNVTARRDLAVIYLDRLRPGRAAELLADARKRFPDDAELLFLTGLAAFRRGRYEEALASFRTALAARERLGKPGPVRIAHWMIAWTLRALKRHDEALAIQWRLEREAAAAGQPDGYVFEEIGENLLAQKRGAEAAPSFARAYALLKDDTYLQANEAARLERLRTLGGAP